MAAQIDLVLINPANREQIYQALGKTLSAIEPPVWAGLMATYARGHGHSEPMVRQGRSHGFLLRDIARCKAACCARRSSRYREF